MDAPDSVRIPFDSVLVSYVLLISPNFQFGRSALHHAALNGSMAAAKVLIDRGARLDIRSLDGRTPFNYAAENLKVEMLQYLSHCAQEVETPISFDGNLSLIF